MVGNGLGLTGSRTDRRMHAVRLLELIGQSLFGCCRKLRLVQNPSEKSVGVTGSNLCAARCWSPLLPRIPIPLGTGWRFRGEPLGLADGPS